MPANKMRDDEVQELYSWVDQVSLSRPKRNFTRDFSDGVLFAETVSYFFPHLVEVHNYSAANSFSQKMYNWQTLNKKVMTKIRLTLTQQEMEDCANCVPFAMEKIMLKLQARHTERLQRSSPARGERSAPPSAAGRRPPAADIFEAAPRGDGPPSSGGSRLPSRQQQQQQQQRPSPHKQVASPGRARHLGGRADMQREVDTEMLVEKEQQIQDLKETVDILETKIKKLEQLLRLKDAKISALTTKLDEGAGH